ncbi:MAG: pyruvate ferredoxin oxidoreductase [Prevotella sp.]|nr:pyruvate ferredoxin oxidoreductase [Prevotella sp.]
MDYKYIEQLLDRYFQGETSLQEEQILKAFYAQGVDDMPEELAKYTPLFNALGEKEQLGDDFDKRLLQMTEGTVKVKARTIRLTERLRPLFGAAAVVAILLTLGNAINQSFKQDDTWVDADEYAKRGAIEVNTNEPAMAYEQNATDSLVFAKEGRAAITPTDSMPSGQIN